MLLLKPFMHSSLGSPVFRMRKILGCGFSWSTWSISISFLHTMTLLMPSVLAWYAVCRAPSSSYCSSTCPASFKYHPCPTFLLLFHFLTSSEHFLRYSYRFQPGNEIADWDQLRVVISLSQWISYYLLLDLLLVHRTSTDLWQISSGVIYQQQFHYNNFSLKNQISRCPDCEYSVML